MQISVLFVESMVVPKNIVSTTHFRIIFEEPILNTLTVAATTEGEKEGQQPQDWTSHQRWIETLTTRGHIGKAPALHKSAYLARIAHPFGVPKGKLWEI